MHFCFVYLFFLYFFRFFSSFVGNPFSVYYDPFLVAAAQQVQAQAAAANSIQAAAQVDPNYRLQVSLLNYFKNFLYYFLF